MDNNSLKQTLDILKIKISICKINLFLTVIVFGMLVYKIHSRFWKLTALFLGICLFSGIYGDLDKYTNAYNKALRPHADNTKTNPPPTSSTITHTENKTYTSHIDSDYFYDDTPNYIIDNLYDEDDDDDLYGEKFDDEVHHCEMCGRLLTEDEYDEYMGYCEDCYSDLNVDYQKHGLTDYNEPFIDAIDDPYVYDDFFHHKNNDNDFDDDLFNDDVFSDDFDEF